MAEPLSITASIMTVLEFTNEVISVCHDYSAAVHGAPWQLTQTRAELEGLRSVLQTLEPLARQAEGADPAAVIKLPALALLVGQDSLLRNCETEIKRLAERLKTPSWAERHGKNWRAIVEALKWPLQETESKKILTNIRNFRDILAFAIDGDTAQLALETQKLSLSSNDTIKATQGDVNLLKDATSKAQIDITSTKDATLELQQYAQLAKSDNQRHKIQSWLSAPDPSTNYNRALCMRSNNTGGWFLESEAFKLWCERQSLLRLHGKCGSGKTILSSTIIQAIIERCSLKGQTAIAYFFFDFSDNKKQNLDNMLRSIACQLLKQFQGDISPIDHIYDGRRRHFEIVLEILRFLLQAFDKAYIILDALDECSDRHEMGKILKAIQSWECPPPNMLITSRKFPDIEKMLNSVAWPQETVNIETTVVDADIFTYVDETLKTDPRFKRWRDNAEIQKEITETLLEKSNGMFRWVACQLESLQGCLTRRALRRALKSLPKTLDETYARILRNLPEEHAQDVITLLQWLAFSARPLRIEELAETIAINVAGEPWLDVEARLEDPLEVVDLCPGLIDIEVSDKEISAYGLPATQHKIVRLAHFSVKEYLLSRRIHAANAAQYAIQEISAHENIAAACLAYLLQFDERGKLTQESFKDFPLAKYAAMYWTHHTRALGHNLGSVKPLCLKLLLARQEVFLNWIRLGEFDGRERFVDPDVQPERTAPPLYYISWRGVTEVVRLLLDEGADVEAADKYGENALMPALLNGHEATARLLLDRGANVNAQSGEHETPLQMAASFGADRIIRLLLDYGADVNLEGGECGNALQEAILSENETSVQLLLTHGANMNLPTRQYGTALELARDDFGDNNILQLLLDHRGDRESTSERMRKSTRKIPPSSDEDKARSNFTKHNCVMDAAVKIQDEEHHSPSMVAVLDLGRESRTPITGPSSGA